ncbi:unnamed protein product [Linum tenue]|uniref:Uncharacterized protein n=1 Tax=Linum tenue TaxID=586396 RepID=A0AAV0NX47_9ROSI|nr:unnamed protein product [Linum tenue]
MEKRHSFCKAAENHSGILSLWAVCGGVGMVPRFRMLPAETKLSALLVVFNLPEKALPISALQCKTYGGTLF